MASKILLPGERQRSEIVIQTRIGSPISNVQEHDLPPRYLKLAEELDKKYHEPFVLFVNNPSPYYNCHGLTFGSRRSAISDPQEILKILEEDDYTLVEDKDVQKGDIIVYFGNDGDAEHSGLVIGERNGLPLILSKWGYGKEAVHTFSMCPYDSSTVRYYRILK